MHRLASHVRHSVSLRVGSCVSGRDTSGAEREQTWLTRIPCKYGYIAPHGDRLLAAYCDAGLVKRRELCALPCVEVAQGDATCSDVIVTLNVADTEQVAAVLNARRPRRYSPAEKARRRERLQHARRRRKGRGIARYRWTSRGSGASIRGRVGLWVVGSRRAKSRARSGPVLEKRCQRRREWSS